MFERVVDATLRGYQDLDAQLVFAGFVDETGEHNQLEQHSQPVCRTAAHAQRLKRRVILQRELFCFLSWHRQQQCSGELRVRGRLVSS
ncbi:hypothetical protein VL15_15240 [Burkholderia cepacia]|uniref:Uncharacterized protein n=1 Tax=Burkholderia cepacia TaxID=292 RepID=A0A0J5X1Z2_BURCE|nr:hypothetical protein [Burkholderia cepacia]KML57067.1 hypothetical protein VL15_15240 [Burkholderia cepacia]